MFDYYRSKVKAALLVRLQYRGNFLVWTFAGIIQPLILLSVWDRVAQSRDGQLGGFVTGDFAAYFIVMMVVQSITRTWIMWEFGFRIRQGTLSPIMLWPLHPIHPDVAENIAFKLLEMFPILAACGVLSLLFPPHIGTSGLHALLFVPALLLAAVLRFLLEWTLALAAFWMVRVTALNQVYHAAGLLLSGQIAPLSLFPETIQALAATLPFRYFLSFPVEVLLGRLSGVDMAIGFAIQATWICIAYVSFRILWRLGVRRHTAVGA